MNLERRPENAVNWPRAVQSSVAILGALSFGAMAYGYGYGVSSGRTEEVYPQTQAAGLDSLWRVNEPAGFTTRIDNEFTCETGEDWSDDFTEEGTGSPTRDLGAFYCLSDPTAPMASVFGVDSVTANLFMDSTNVNFNVGVLGGGSPNKLVGSNVDWAADSLYVTYWLKFSSDFDDRSTQKIVWAQNNYSTNLYSTNTGTGRETTNAGDSEPMRVFCQNSCTWTGAAVSPMLVQDSLTSPSGGTRLVNGAYVTPGTSIQNYTRGEWEYHEVLWVVNSTTSAEDGELHMWVDGTKVMEYTGVLWLGTNSVGESGPKWDRLMIEVITRNYEAGVELASGEHEALFNGFYVSTN